MFFWGGWVFLGGNIVLFFYTSHWYELVQWYGTRPLCERIATDLQLTHWAVFTSISPTAIREKCVEHIIKYFVSNSHVIETFGTEYPPQ